MQVVPIQTHTVTQADSNLIQVLEQYLTDVPERSVIAIASKIVAICEGRVVEKESASKEELVQQEADYYLPPDENKYGISLTVKDNILIPTAGIDESNSGGAYILWPSHAQETANLVREWAKKRFNLRQVGVCITDSKTTPLRWGTTGVALAHSGFAALHSYIGELDLFQKPLRVTKANHMDALAAAAVLVMGEGSEQTPLALLSDLPFLEFQDRNPTEKEIASLRIPLHDDLYAAMLTAVQWQKKSDKQTL